MKLSLSYNCLNEYNIYLPNIKILCYIFNKLGFEINNILYINKILLKSKYLIIGQIIDILLKQNILILNIRNI